MMVVIS